VEVYVSNDSIFLYPRDAEDDAIALPKLREYYASQRNQPPDCDARTYWDKFVNMADDELLAHWRAQVAHKGKIIAAYRAAGH
jgi:hypothetical protein